MANVLLVQPNWPTPAKIKDPQKYWPYPLIKLGALCRKRGDKVALVLGNEKAHIPFKPDRVLVTTVFSWWFGHVRDCVQSYKFLYPDAEIEIGGVHASLMPEVYREAFPYAKVHVGVVPEAEDVEPAWDLLRKSPRTQILRFSDSCPRSCRFCYCHLEPYRAYTWDQVVRKIRFRRLILNDNNFLAHPEAREILRRLETFTIQGKSLMGIEIQGGFDCRILCNSLDLIPLMRKARVQNIRLAWDGNMDMLPAVETCVEALARSGYDVRQMRCYMLYNFDLPFEVVVEKLRCFEKMRLGPVHSRFRPKELLFDGYVSQKRSQTEREYYVHVGWTDKKIRVIGSLASDISRMARANVACLDEVRRYYGRPSVEETLRNVA